MEVTLKLNVDQVNAILSAISELPIKSGYGQLMQLIVAQVTPQLPPQENTQSED